jgi:VanZ family protein
LTPETERKIMAWVPAIAYTGLIFGISSITGLSPPGVQFKLFDKVAHAVEYAGLALFLTLAFRRSLAEGRRRMTPIFVIIVGLVIGVLDELYQFTVPGRSVEFLDWVGDAVGVTAAAVAVAIHERLAARTRLGARPAGG